MHKSLGLALHGLVGWAICGSTIAIGRQLVSMETTLLVHAVVAPLAFGLLTWHHLSAFPESSAGGIALTMTGMVIGLDALVVAPFFEGSYAMFRSVLGTWVPFASIAGASYLVARIAGSRRHDRAGGERQSADGPHVAGGRG